MIWDCTPEANSQVLNKVSERGIWRENTAMVRVTSVSFRTYSPVVHDQFLDPRNSKHCGANPLRLSKHECLCASIFLVFLSSLRKLVA